MIGYLAVTGYRLFREFETELQPEINVLIGANGSGKSSLVELLRIIQSCCKGPIRRGIEPKPILGRVFHPGCGDTIAWYLFASPPGARAPSALPRPKDRHLFRNIRACWPASQAPGFRYYLELTGAAPPVIRNEVLAELPSEAQLLGARDGLGGLDELDRTKEWHLEPNEPMLSRATDPKAAKSCAFRNDVLGWRFYTELQVHRVAPLRQPQPLESGTALAEDGSNLASVLLSLFTNLDYQEQRDEFLSFLRSAVPGFRTLTPTPDSISNHVILQWVEDGVDAKLSAADLSDGVLRLLAIGAICCNPHPPSLICIDEPEIGLHPSVLPLVGGLLRCAARRSQVIVLTHSPDLLYGMPMESIAVMRREEGEARIVWPGNEDLLCNLVSREVAGERELDPERLRQAYLSGELDTLG